MRGFRTQAILAAIVGSLSCDMVDQMVVAVPMDPPPLCSQARRAIAHWQGREGAECRPDISAALELTSVGDGRLLFRRRLGNQDQLVDMRDGSFSAPIPIRQAVGESVDEGTAGVVPLPPEPGQPVNVLLHDPRSTDWRMYTTVDPKPALYPYPQDLLATPQRGTWPAGPAAQTYWKAGTGNRPWGHAFLGLENGYVLDRDLGTGAYRFWRFVRSTTDNRLQLLEPDTFVGGPRAEFRRGHRLVYLAPGRLLEWMPRPCARDSNTSPLCIGADYRVWTYDLGTSGKPHDPISEQPLSSGFWAGIGDDHDVVLGDSRHLVVWTRSEGSLRSVAFDPAALGPGSPDPLAGGTVASTIIPDIKSGSSDPPTTSPNLRNIIVVLQDGRSFDSYFGRYCTGAAGPDGPPSCTDGPACCEAMPASILGAPTCRPLDPTTDTHRPNDTPWCMRAKMNQGLMDAFATAAPIAGDTSCGDPADFACPGDEPGAIGILHGFASRGALADRFFQTYAFPGGELGSTFPSPFEQNFLYLVTTRFSVFPPALGDTPVLTKELARVQVPWAMYTGDDTAAQLWPFQGPLFYDPLWSPFRSLTGELDADIASGQLPSVTIVMPEAGDAAKSEAPGHPFASGLEFTAHVIEALARSPQASSTLVLVAYTTAGGYYDHVKPPEHLALTVDSTTGGPEGAAIYYGPRTPLVALGRFARKNHIAHGQLEMSSISVFMEWNWLGARTLKGSGQRTDLRSYRDLESAHNLGSLLDPAATGIDVP